MDILRFLFLLFQMLASTYILKIGLKGQLYLHSLIEFIECLLAVHKRKNLLVRIIIQARLSYLPLINIYDESKYLRSN